MRAVLTIVASLSSAALLLSPQALAQERPLTTAESSQFKATTRHAEAMAFIRELQRQSSRLRVETLAVSIEGREVPMLVIGNPPPASPLPSELDGRAVIYYQANIHAGEVEGKEATLMLARDLVLAEPAPEYLEKLVILIVPIFNADGNERISPDNRARQNGPEQGVGERHNGQNLDLNREGMKLESPEAQGLVQNALVRWDPIFFLDAHTHNGSYHEEPVTYTWGFSYNADARLARYLSDVMMPAVEEKLRTEHDVSSVPHGDFIDVDEPEKGWIPAGPEPRFLSNYVGLRNRLSLLNEQYPYADFETRVRGCYALLVSILEYASENRDEMVDLVAEVDRSTIARGRNPSADDSFGVEFDVRADKTYTIQGYAMRAVPGESERRPRVEVDFAEKRTYRVPYLVDYYATRTVPWPHGYLITTADRDIERKLLQHGLLVERLEEPLRVSVESFTVTSLDSAERLFQGHLLKTARGTYETVEKEFPSGTLFVTTAQPLGNVVAYLLEPESDDGLLTWSFLDRHLARGFRPAPFPIYKLMKPVPMVKTTVKR